MRRRSGDGPKPLRHLLGKVMRRTAPALDHARHAWSRAVAPEVARQTRVVALRGGVLDVEVASAALLQELETFRRQDVLRALSAGGRAAGLEVNKLRFRLGAFADAGPNAEARPRASERETRRLDG